MKRMYMTYTSWVWDSDEPDTEPTIDGGFYDEAWGEFSTENKISITEFQELRDGVSFDMDLDEWDIEEGISLATKVALFIIDEGLADEYGNGWFSCEPYITDYRTGKSREIDLHFHNDDWTASEIAAVTEEVDYQIACREALKNERYFESVKAIV